MRFLGYKIRNQLHWDEKYDVTMSKKSGTFELILDSKGRIMVNDYGFPSYQKINFDEHFTLVFKSRHVSFKNFFISHNQGVISNDS